MTEYKDTVAGILEQVISDFCDNYCKYPNMPIPEGKNKDWLIEDEDSPCRKCPCERLI